MSLSDVDQGLLRKIAVICKDYYVIRTIDDLFIFAGADPAWKEEAERSFSSERMSAVYGWAEGVAAHAPDQIEEVVLGVSIQIVENDGVPRKDRAFLRRRLSLGEAALPTKKDMSDDVPRIPRDIEELLERLVQGLPRAMFPLKQRRRGLPALSFDNEYDVQALFHALIRPWVNDIRTEEYTPSYAGSSTRVDFLLDEYSLVVEIKIARSARHAGRIGDELVLDISHYKEHPRCEELWAVVFDPRGHVRNPDGLKRDLEGKHSDDKGEVRVRTFVLSH